MSADIFCQQVEEICKKSQEQQTAQANDEGHIPSRSKIDILSTGHNGNARLVRESKKKCYVLTTVHYLCITVFLYCLSGRFKAVLTGMLTINSIFQWLIY